MIDRTLRTATEEFQRIYISVTLYKHQGNMSQAARALGMDRPNLYRKMKLLGMQAPASFLPKKEAANSP